jgi:hypothetical protein
MLKHYSHIRMEPKRRALESIVNGKPSRAKPNTEEQIQGVREKSRDATPSRRQPAGKGHSTGKKEEASAAETSEDHYSAMPTVAQHFEGEYPQKSPQSVDFEVEKGTLRPCKSMNVIGGRGRNRKHNETYFQLHAGQRLTPKTMKISRNPINRAQM